MKDTDITIMIIAIIRGIMEFMALWNQQRLFDFKHTRSHTNINMHITGTPPYKGYPMFEHYIQQKSGKLGIGIKMILYNILHKIMHEAILLETYNI